MSKVTFRRMVKQCRADKSLNWVNEISIMAFDDE